MTHDEKREAYALAACKASGDDPSREGPFRRWYADSPYAAIADAILALNLPPATGTGKHDEKREIISDALMDSQYLAGAKAGWNAAHDKNPEDAFASLLASREGHLAGFKDARSPLPPATSEIGVEYRRGLEDAAKVVGERAAEYRAAVVGASMQQALALNRVADELSNQAAAIRSLSAAPTPRAEEKIDPFAASPEGPEFVDCKAVIYNSTVFTTKDENTEPPATSEIGAEAEEGTCDQCGTTGWGSDHAIDCPNNPFEGESGTGTMAEIRAVGDADYRRGLEDAADVASNWGLTEGRGVANAVACSINIAAAIRSLSAAPTPQVPEPDTSGYAEWADEGEKGNA